MKNAIMAVLISLPLSASAQWEESTYPYDVPLGLEKPMVPEDNEVTSAKVDLGKLLYFDGRLSRDGTISCATCHDPRRGWTDQAPVSTGIRGQKGGRNSPTVLNAAFSEEQFWDGRAASLEEQAKGPIENPIEMDFTHKEAVARISKIKGYRKYFKAAFNDPKVTIDRIAQAIATFERTALTGNAPYDRYEAGDKKALTDAQKKGMALFFGKANCTVCHSGPAFSDFDYHNIGVGMAAKEPDWGRFDHTKDEDDRGKFKTPGLRNLSDTWPYMHDGSQTSLMEVIEFYDQGGEDNHWLDRDMKKLSLSEQEKLDLVAFLKALDGDRVAVEPPSELPQ